jgi:hypothetical protein
LPPADGNARLQHPEQFTGRGRPSSRQGHAWISFIPAQESMHRSTTRAATSRGLSLAIALFAALGACADTSPLGPGVELYVPPEDALQALECTVSRSGGMNCQDSSGSADSPAATIIGGQNVNVRLTSTNDAYDPDTETFSVDVTVQNLLNEAIGTPDGVVADPEGIRVFFAGGPTVTGGAGTVTVANADGTDLFTREGQPFFRYSQLLAKDEVSAAKTWRFNVPVTVAAFKFRVYISTDIQYKLVINEVLVNPGGTITDFEGEWFEIYNAGSFPVDLQNLVIADSALSGRRPFHLISSSVVVAPDGYVVLGTSTNTTTNGGVPVNYSYGNALALANSQDAIKISRVYFGDTLTLNRTRYASAAVSAQNGISRELKHPALDNSNMDSSNWADAAVTAVYGPGGRGTPGAQNSQYTPSIAFGLR